MVTHKGTQTLTTPRLVLRRFKVKDAEAAYRNWTSDTKVTKFLTWPVHDSAAVTQTVLQSWVEGYAKEDFYQWAIVPKECGEPIGSISVVSGNDRVGKAHVGYCIGSAWWNQGIMTEALKAVIDFLFDEVGMQRVEARHDPRNPHSGGVMRKCGMQYEGTQRRADRNNQGLCDACWYAILSDDVR